MILEADKDGDGFIDLNEFIELNTKGVDSKEVLESLKDAFSIFDIDGNRLISAKELHKVLRSLGEQCSVGECKKMISGVDVDGDGRINFDEFKGHDGIRGYNNNNNDSSTNASPTKIE